MGKKSTIPLLNKQTARKWINNYTRWANEPVIKVPIGRIESNVFTKEQINLLLAQDGAEGIRFYYGIMENSDDPNPIEASLEPGQKLIAMAVDGKGRDITKVKKSALSKKDLEHCSAIDIPSDQGIITYSNVPCPPFCGDGGSGG